MKHEVGCMNALLTVALLASGGVARAQETQEAAPPPQVVIQRGVMATGDAFFEEDHIELLGFGGELHSGKVVKGAPFSAVGVSESTQTLADGNRITRKTETSLYRDSQGRFRKEVALPAIGPLAASGKPHSFVVIRDPVAGTSFVLEPDQKVARKTPAPPTGIKFGATTGGPSGEIGFHREFKAAAEATVKTESLGTQTIDGISAEGTRTTRTIAAGEIGNDNPITIVSERWYSADLELVIKSTHSDPRFGDTIYTVTNIQRTEPDATLFTIPADYAVKEGGPGPNMIYRHGFDKAPPPPPNE